MDRHADAVGQVSLYGGAASGLALWGLNLSELGAIASGVVAVLGFILTFIMSLRRDAREKAVQAATLESIRGASNKQDTPPQGSVSDEKARG